MKTTKSISKLNVKKISKNSLKSILGGGLVIIHVGQRQIPAEQCDC